MIGTNAVRNLIRENQLAQLYSMIQTGARYGMQTMEDSINDLLAAGLVSQEDANAYLKDATDGSDDAGAAPAQPGKKGAPPPVKGGKPGAPAAKSPTPVQEGGADGGGYSF